MSLREMREQMIQIMDDYTIRFKLEQHEGTQLITLYASEQEALNALNAKDDKISE